MQESPTILLAEDDDGHAFLIQKSLRAAGFRNIVVRFSDGQEAWEFLLGPSGPLVVTDGPLVVLLDIRMPKMDGIEVLRRIRERRELDGVPVIMVTTTDDPGEVERCRRLGCTSYLVKAVNWRLFTAALADLTVWLAPPMTAPGAGA
jgi:CheY-like chemotaxis protein